MLMIVYQFAFKNSSKEIWICLSKIKVLKSGFVVKRKKYFQETILSCDKRFADKTPGERVPGEGWSSVPWKILHGPCKPFSNQLREVDG